MAPERRTSQSSMQSAPATMECTRVRTLRPGRACPAGHRGQSPCWPDHRFRAGSTSWPPGPRRLRPPPDRHRRSRRDPSEYAILCAPERCPFCCWVMLLQRVTSSQHRGRFHEWSDPSGRGQGRQFGGSRLSRLCAPGIRHLSAPPVQPFRNGDFEEVEMSVMLALTLLPGLEEKIVPCLRRGAEASSGALAPRCPGRRRLRCDTRRIPDSQD